MRGAWIALAALTACGPSVPDRVASLEMRVTKLEQERELAKAHDQSRQDQLEGCVQKAEEAYWSYLKLNGKVMPDGTIRASSSDIEQARRQKELKLKECQALYGR